MQEIKSLLHKERLKEKLGKQDFHYDMEEVFEPITENQKQNQTKQQELSEKQIQALRDSTRAASQTTVQAIENQTQAIRESIKEGIQEYDEITNRKNQLLTILVNSNQVDSSIVKTVSNLLNDKNKSHFILEPINGNREAAPNLFTINPLNPQPVLIKGSTMTFQNEHSYDLNDPDLQYFITNTQFDREIENVNTIFTFLNEMNCSINYGDKKAMRYYFIKDLINQYTYQQSHWGNTLDNNQMRSGLNGSYTNQYVFLPSDPDELVEQLKLLYFEKLGGNVNPQLNEQIIAIVDKLLEYECITTKQHQNIQNNFGSTSV